MHSYAKPAMAKETAVKEITVITQKGDAQVFAVSGRVGDVFVLTLPSNPSTGYSWEIAALPAQFDSAKQDFKPQNTAKGLTGAPVDTVFRFVGKTTGTGFVTLVYRRPWEQASPPADVVVGLITVE